MITTGLPPLSSVGHPLDLSPEAFGFLRETTLADAEDAALLRDRLNEDGYLYLPGLLGREAVRDARLAVLERAQSEGLLDPNSPLEDGVLREKINPYFRPAYTDANPSLMRVLYGDDEPLMRLFDRFFGAPVRHFDFTWMRVVGPGRGTAPHCDVVYMGRGTHDLLTAWTPLGDIPLSVGGLMVLENSHRQSPVALGEYLQQDVDTFCDNGPNAETIKAGKFGWEHYDGSFAKWSGDITDNPVALRETLGGRWLTAGKLPHG